MPNPAAPRKPKAEGWFHPLQAERMEVFLKVDDAKGNTLVKLRASGPESEMGELIDWFERISGMRVDVPTTAWRITRKPRELTGQLGFDVEAIAMQDSSLSNSATLPDDG